jgi:hypothetical protein
MGIWGFILGLALNDFNRDIHCRPVVNLSGFWASIDSVNDGTVVLESYLGFEAASPYHYRALGTLYTTFTGKGQSTFRTLHASGSYVDISGEHSATLQVDHDATIDKIYLDFSNDREFGNGSFIRLTDGTTYSMDCGTAVPE